MTTIVPPSGLPTQVTRFNGDFHITGANPSGNVVVNSHSLIVNGNLVVLGTSSNVSTTNTQISDNIITLNDGESGAGVSLQRAGIDVNRGTLTTASIYWNEAPDDGGDPRWEITDNNGNFNAVATTAGFAVRNDPAPQLGGNLDVTDYAITSSTSGVVTFNANIAMEVMNFAPEPITNHNVIYSQTPGTGGSGIFVTNETARGEELITKSRAFIFALIM